MMLRITLTINIWGKFQFLNTTIKKIDLVENFVLRKNSRFSVILDSERSEECIDFTMIITSRNNAPISNFGGGFRCKSEYPWCIIE
ncbi:Uncharacterized protein FWK35_00007248, partial [Aphis craccivora]